MIRREFLKRANNFIISLYGIALLGGCGAWGSKTSTTSQLAYLLIYLLYGDNLPAEAVDKIGKQLEAIFQNSLTTKLELDRLCLRLNINKEKPFQALSSQNKKEIFKQIMPMLVERPEIINVLKKYFQKEGALKYLDYPDLPGDFGECGWLVIEGEVWDRYYPPSG